MPGGKRYPAGPLAYVAIGLFVMTWASLRMWQPTPIAHQSSPSPDLAPDVPAPIAAPATRPEITVATNVAQPVAEIAATAKPTVKTPAALVLEELTTVPMVAEIAPPVATRIEFDPVMSLEPEFEMNLEPALTQPVVAAAPQAEEMPELTMPAELLERMARATVERTPQLDRAWPYAESLVRSLQILEGFPASAGWAQETLAELNRLFEADSLASPAAAVALDALERLSDDAKRVAAQGASREERVTMSRASFGLVRRLLVWRDVHQLASSEFVSAGLNDEDVLRGIQNARHHFASAPTWQDYLLLSQLKAATHASAEERGELARRVLLRLESGTLNDQQRKALAHPSVTQLGEALSAWAATPVDLSRLLDSLETLELGDNSRAGRDVATAWQQLRWSHDPSAVALGEHINTYYRNANARVAISGELLNLLMPSQAATQEAVDDQILGARVFGRSQTSARLRVVLLPDMRRLRLGLEAIGEVDSDTAATKGPATLYSQGVSRFHARKMLSVDRDGLRIWRSKAEVATDTELTDVETDFDGLPFVGMLARAVARQEHDDRYWEANHEVRGKVAARAEHRFDAQVHQQLAEAESEFLKRIYQPLERLQLEPTAVDLRTTREQLIARYRVAGHHQLAAYTPRPRVPDNSVLNVQLHQSTLNNVIEQLNLDGKRTDLETLYRELGQTFNRPLQQEMLDQLPEGVTVQFADRDAVRVYCDGGRLLLVIKLVELAQGRERKWKDFTVQAYYTPNISTLDAKLVREGTIELIGTRLNFRDQIALRGVFTKVLSKDRTFDLVPEKLARDPRLQHLSIGQFTIDDGWIGLAVVQPGENKPRVACHSVPLK